MKPEFYKKKLSNGLVVLFEKRKLPVVTVSTAVRFGAEYESAELKGVSHFIEHLVFKGTKKRNVKQISEEIEKKGGIINAFTSEEITGYWNKLPSKYLSTGIDLCSDLVLHPLFERDALERERQVILEEIKMYHDNPQFHVFEKIKELLYEKPFGMNITGTDKTMTSITMQDILKIFSSVYSTNRMILSVVGKADFKQICELGNKIFPKTSSLLNESIPIKRNAESIEKRKGIDQANLILGFHFPTLRDKYRYSAEIFDVILGKGMSSRLFQEIREKRGLAYSIKGALEQDKNYAHELIYAGTTKDKVKKIKELILNEIKKMQKLELRDLNEAKEQLIGLRDVGNEDGMQAMMNLILEENAGNAEEYYKYGQKINSVKLQDVRNLAKLKNYSFAALVPE